MRTPDFSKLTSDELNSWNVAAKLLSRRDVTTKYPKGHAFTVALETETVAADGPIGFSTPFEVQIGEQTVNLGEVEIWLDAPTLAGRAETDGQIWYSFTTPDRKVRYHRSEVSTE